MTMYQVVEHIKGKNETYTIAFENDAELTYWLNGKRNWINEKKDSIVAWKIDNYEMYVDLERIWNREETMKKLLKAV